MDQIKYRMSMYFLPHDDYQGRITIGLFLRTPSVSLCRCRFYEGHKSFFLLTFTLREMFLMNDVSETEGKTNVSSSVRMMHLFSPPFYVDVSVSER